MAMNERVPWRVAAGISGFMAIAMGAAGAHIAANPALASLVEKGSLYQLIHAVLLLTLVQRREMSLRVARWLIISGTLLFCGSFYLKGLGIMESATHAAPFGGVSFMAAWLLVAWAR